jgi:L-lysine 2,3-aminomutase
MCTVISLHHRLETKRPRQRVKETKQKLRYIEKLQQMRQRQKEKDNSVAFLIHANHHNEIKSQLRKWFLDLKSLQL